MREGIRVRGDGRDRPASKVAVRDVQRFLSLVTVVDVDYDHKLAYRVETIPGGVASFRHTLPLHVPVSSGTQEIQTLKPVGYR